MARHLLAVFRGGIGPAAAPPEEWSFGMRFSGSVAATPGADDRSVVQSLAEQFRDKAMAAWPTLSFHNSVQFTRVKVYIVDDVTGKATAEVVESVVPTLTQGAATANRHPNQCSTVVTFDAGFPAPGRYGRVFLPPQGIGVGPDGRIDEPSRDSVANAMQTFVNALQNPTGPDTLDLIIYSKRHALKRDVKTIRVGRVIDTMRSRRGDLAEEYAVRPVG
jgi:hypothetical protein